MKFGDRPLAKGSVGNDVVELQLRLAGFEGTIWDGDFGPKTERQVKAFQKDFMGLSSQSGRVHADTYEAIDEFADQFKISFVEPLKCIYCTRNDGDFCTRTGFGQQRFRSIYLTSRSPIKLDWSRLNQRREEERRHQYEYPGIHKAVLHTYRAFIFYAGKHQLPSPVITSGYRCHINNVRRNRTSTNHMGKALDFSFSGLDHDQLHGVCQAARQLLLTKSHCQLRWDQANRKGLEPGIQERPGEFIAKTWVHLDVRQYETVYLADKYFVQNARSLDAKGID